MLTLVGQAPSGARAAAATRATAPALAGAALSPYFERNDGQADGRVRFLARGEGSALLLSPTAAELALGDGTVRQRFLGTGGPAAISGERRLPGTSNYLVGDDPSRWRTAVPHFERVRYSELYAGIDLVFYIAGSTIEYDFVVAPGATPDAIRFDFEGANGVTIDGDGDLVVRAAGAEVRHRAPSCYQVADGGERQAVAARFAVAATGEVRLEVGGYDPARPLVVDPVLEFSTIIGEGNANAVAVDANGNSYIVGTTSSPDFPTTDPLLTPAGDDAFVVKLDPTGSTLLYTTFFGGAGTDVATAIAVDASGRAYVAGYTESADMPTANAFQEEYAGAGDAFVLELGADGDGIVFATYLGGTAFDYPEGVAVTAAGEACVTGWTRSTDFPTATPIQTDPDPELEDAFVTKLAVGGSSLIYSTYLGGPGDPDIGTGIAVDAAGNAYVAGFAAPGFPTTPGAYRETGGYDAFVAKIDPLGADLVYSTFLGGLEPTANTTWAKGIAIDGDGNAYVTGWTNSEMFPTINAAQPNPGNVIPDTDAFVAKFNASGSALVYSTYLGGGDHDETTAIAVDDDGRAVVVGFTYSDKFPAKEPLYGGALAGETDAFVTRLGPTGSTFEYSTRIPEAWPRSVAVDGAGDAYVAGFIGTAEIFPAFTVLQPGLDPGAPVAKGWVLRLSAATAADTPGVYVAGTGAWFLRNTNAGGEADAVFTFGAGGAGLVALRGDWDGDGDDTPGLYDPGSGAFFLRNVNAPGPADVVFGFGPSGAALEPLVGDWNGDGRDTVGLYDPSNGFFFLRNANAPGPADLVFGFGSGGFGRAPIVGDWNDDAVDTVGVYDAETGAVFLTNRNQPGPADAVFTFGPPASGWTPLSGDWDGDGDDTVGLYDPSTGFYFLRNANAPGSADLVFGYGPPASSPLVGDWNGR